MLKKIYLQLTPAEISTLKAIAAHHGLRHGGEGSLKKLLSAIAKGAPSATAKGAPSVTADHSLLLQVPPTPTEIEAWLQCLSDVIKAGHIDAAQKLALQLRRFPLDPEQTKIIEDWLELGSWGVIGQLYAFIEKRQSFTLSYNDSEGKDHLYTVNYAHLEHIERHRYLVARVTESAENPEHPDLAFNRCFRLDRILAVVERKNQDIKWQKLDTTPVKFRLHGNWTKKYERKLGDCDLTWIIPLGGEDEAILEITRKVWSFFWFLREIKRYSKVQIVEPESLKNQHIRGLQENLKVYD